MIIRRIKGAKILFFCFLFIVSSSCIYAGIFDDLEIIPGIRFWGADIGLNYKGVSIFPSLTTRLCIWFGSGMETVGYFRDIDKVLYSPPSEPEETSLALYNRLNILWALGLRQGLFKDPAKDDNLLEAYIFYRGLYDKVEDSTNPNAFIYSTNYSDGNGVLLHTIVAGLYFDSVVIHETQRKRNGVQTDISLEIAPRFLHNKTNLADYSRVTVDIRGFLTLIDPDPENSDKKNFFNLYISDRILSDGIIGNSIPITAMQTVGGRSLMASDALGGIMRGIEPRRFDGYLKIVNNFDIRMNLPSFRIFVPGIVLYFDTGIADNLDYYLRTDNLHYSTGVGVFVYGFGFDLILYGNYWIDEKKFSMSFDFSLQF